LRVSRRRSLVSGSTVLKCVQACVHLRVCECASVQVMCECAEIVNVCCPHPVCEHPNTAHSSKRRPAWSTCAGWTARRRPTSTKPLCSTILTTKSTPRVKSRAPLAGVAPSAMLALIHDTLRCKDTTKPKAFGNLNSGRPPADALEHRPHRRLDMLICSSRHSSRHSDTCAPPSFETIKWPSVACQM
jgi:hypothetical protein